jgi:hypothetical protein
MTGLVRAIRVATWVAAAMAAGAAAIVACGGTPPPKAAKRGLLGLEKIASMW